MYQKKLGISITIILLLAACSPSSTVTPSMVPAKPSATPSANETMTPQKTKLPRTLQSIPTTGPGGIAPYLDAPLCPDAGEAHDHSLFHTLWDSTQGCHYDHEHGQNPFTPEVAATFPGFDLQRLLGGVGVGHTNPSSPMENTHKHGGFKWQITIPHPTSCAGHEGSTIGVDASAIQYHAFGDYSIEFQSRVHSVVALMRQCTLEDPTDYGYVYLVQHVDYGQRVSGYQGNIVPYPDNPQPAYDSADAPYFTVDCIGATCASKTSTRELILASDANAGTTWTSDPRHLVGSGSHLFELLFRARDTYQVLDRGDVEYPPTFVWLCSNDEGLTYMAMPGCRYNNSTTTIHEINGTIPAEWDNLSGFDTDSRVGRITAEGYVTRFGELNTSCTASAPDCHPIKLVQAFMGYYGSMLIPDKGIQFKPAGLPERDIYFCGKQVCTEGDPGAGSSGWIGQNN